MPYDFHAKKAFVTWPNANHTLEAFYAALEALDSTSDASFRLARELHEDGTPHFHALVIWPTKKRSRDARWLDCAGQHPNIQPVRNHQASFDYVSKDGAYMDKGSVEPSPTTSDRWKSALEAHSPNTFEERIKEASARDYIVNYERIITFRDVRFKQRSRPYVSNPDWTFETVPALRDWEAQRQQVGNLHFLHPPLRCGGDPAQT